MGVFRSTFFLTTLTGFILLVVITSVTSKFDLDNSTDDQLWKQYLAKYNLKFAKPREYNRRKSIFVRNLKKIREHNKKYKKGLTSFRKGINKFTHLTYLEFVRKHTGVVTRIRYSFIRRLLRQIKRIKRDVIPAKIDLRDTLYVTPVRDQGPCSSSYAFAAIDLIEYHYCQYSGGQMPGLSVQQVIDCSQGYGNSGCDGGLYTSTWNYLQSFKGIATSEEYPYVAKVQDCNGTKSVHFTSLGAVNIPKSQRIVMEYLAKIGPIAVTFHASDSFQIYESGVLDDEDCDKPANHAMTLIGYGRHETEGDYWLLKNSYGISYGEAGYIRVRRGVNMCRILERPMGIKVLFKKKEKKTETVSASVQGYDCTNNKPCTAANRDLGHYYFPYRFDKKSFVQCGLDDQTCWVMKCGPGTTWNQVKYGCS